MRARRDEIRRHPFLWRTPTGGASYTSPYHPVAAAAAADPRHGLV